MGKSIIIGQSGGPTSVINASLAGVVSAARELDGDLRVYGMRNGIQGLLDSRAVLLNDLIKTEDDLQLLMRTPSAYLGSCRYKLPSCDKAPEVYANIFEQLKKLDIGCFLYIGGNDSMDTIKNLSAYAAQVDSDIRFIGIPKTIDNDLTVTDHSPGFGSAAKYIACSVKELIMDNTANDMDTVSIIEIMGRDAGWLTGAAALSAGDDCDGPDLIYLPELVFDVNAFVARVREIQKKRRSVIVCVSEGIRMADGRYVCEYTDIHADSRTIDAFGHKQLTGTARVLADIINERIGCKVRAIEFSSLQRCAAHLQSGVDMEEAFRAGTTALRAALDGRTGCMVVFKRTEQNGEYGCDMGLCDVKRIANLKKGVPRAWINESGDYVTADFVNYVRPLIQGEVSHIIKDGIPRHIPIIR